ncbi:MAG TPA: hypothetical protein VMN57_16000 [Anaerolineales bacterium]|nr:hypothetical protein [Anaerolineales bacterium]
MLRDRSFHLAERILPPLVVLAGIVMVLVSLGGVRLGQPPPGDGLTTNQFFLVLAGVGVGLPGLVFLLPGRAGRIAGLGLLGAGAVAAAAAADLILVGGLAPPPIRLGLMLVFLGAFTGLRIARETADEGLKTASVALFRFEVRSALRFAAIVFQLVILLLAVRAFELESLVFYSSFFPTVFYGFLLHALLAPTDRLPFFLFLSLAAFIGVLGIVNSLWLTGVVIAAVGIAHLPASFRVRMALIGLGLAVLIVSRFGYIRTVPEIVWPILGAVLMFRFIIYVYDLKHSKKSFGLWSSLSYFFLLPNVLFPFFPVIDHNTFVSSHNKQERYEAYQSGAIWILRGIVHLLLYRAVYYYFVIAPGEVEGPLDLIRFAFTTFLLYLRVSGQFHLIIGILYLFGFSLPRTNDNYLLSANFTDLWRRVNIYWKDFMQKIFYYPAYTWLTRRGLTARPALILTTVYVFFWTWFLHAWYWFWLRGSFLLTANDILFWTILAVLVLVNILRELKTPRARTLGSKTLSLKEIAATGIRNAATISFLTFIWTLWTSPTLGEWAGLWSLALTPRNLGVLALGYAGVVGVFIAINWVNVRLKARVRPLFVDGPVGRRALVHAAVAVAILLAGTPAVLQRIGGRPAALLADMSEARLNDADANLLLRGYYEDLISVSRFNTELWELYSRRPTDWPALHATEGADLTDDFEIVALNPSVSYMFHGAQFSTNSWGMRDREYDLVPPPGAFRTVLVGPSFVMGSGVANEEVFEALVERRLNEDFGGGAHTGYEILNFAVAGHSALQQLYVYEFRALDFQPDALFYVGHQLEETILVRNLVSRLISGSEIPYEYLREIAARAGVEVGMTQQEAESLLAPFGTELVVWTYARLAALSEAHGILPIWVYMPTLEVPNSVEEQARLTEIAEGAGLIVVDLSGVYAGHDIGSISVAPWDLHPNREGHILIAEHLYRELADNPVTAGAFGIENP